VRWSENKNKRKDQNNILNSIKRSYSERSLTRGFFPFFLGATFFEAGLGCSNNWTVRPLEAMASGCGTITLAPSLRKALF